MGVQSEVVDRMWESSSSSSPRSPSRARAVWDKACKRYHLLDFKSVPEYMRDNEFILKYYRGQWPLKHTLLSIFKLHNETLNIWTHLAGFFLFVGLTYYTWASTPKFPHLPHLPHLPNLPHFPNLPHMPNLPHLPDLAELKAEGAYALGFVRESAASSATSISASIPKLVRPITRWPFFLFLAGAMFCLFSSSACHLLSCLGKEAHAIIWRFDYVGIAAMIATSFYPPVYYSFMCSPCVRNLYLLCITVLGILAISVSLIPAFQQPRYRPVRAALFAGMGVSGVVPCMHKLLVFHGEPVAYQTAVHEVIMGLLYGLGAVVYATRVPERWRPGKFDLAGHSHQIFHILVVAGAYTHYKAGLLYLQWRDSTGCGFDG